MTAANRTQAEQETCDLIHHFYAGDVEWLRTVLHPDCSGIGAQSDQYGITVNDIVSNAHAMPDVVFEGEAYNQVYEDSAVVIVMGRYDAYTAPGQDMAFADEQRMTVVWQKSPERLRAVHWHLSNPMRFVHEGERFPVIAAKEAFRSIALMSEQNSEDASISVRDINGSSYHFKLYDIVYVESSKHNVVIHLSDGGRYTVHQGLAELAKEAKLRDDTGFVQVHRSYWVNALYVRGIDDAVVLTNGTRLPIPKRRKNDVRARIAELRQG